MIIVSGVMYWNYSKDYNHVIKENWNISIPSDSDYSEVYSKDAGSSFNEDGVRYHVFLHFRPPSSVGHKHTIKILIYH